MVRTMAQFQWLQLAKTNGEVYVRVSERVDLEGLPFECNLMAVSNTYGLAAVGGQSGESNCKRLFVMLIR